MRHSELRDISRKNLISIRGKEMIKFFMLLVYKMKLNILRISRNSLFLGFVLLAFLGVGYPQAEKVQLTYDHYHSYDEMKEILQKLEKAYPELIKVRSIGKSFEGRNLMMAEVTNYRTGSGDKKTGFYIDGNIHAGEVTGAETALHTLWCLVSRYGSDKIVTDLLDHLVFYILPKVNPDGSEFYLHNTEWIRGNIRPFDDDRDGRMDEDPANDLNKDGKIAQMRVSDPTGGWKIDPKEHRNMVKREPWEREGQFFKIYSEGIDDDDDGNFNEDGTGGLDLNRNFPALWNPEFIQHGAGPWPISEPETKAMVKFILEHPNIGVIINYHTAGRLLYIPTGENPRQIKSNKEDKEIFELIGSKYTNIVGGPVKPAGYRLSGMFIVWGYQHTGAIALLPELWQMGKDYNNDGQIDSYEKLRWNDEVLDRKGFTEWSPFNHPQLGPVEIGGWREKFVRQNPPAGPFLKEICDQHYRWTIYIAKLLPRLEIVCLESKKLSEEFFKITGIVRNSGYFPTNITHQAVIARAVAPVLAELKLPKGAEILMGKEITNLGQIAGNFTDRIVEWLILSPNSGEVCLKVISTRAGTSVRKIQLR